MNVKKRGSLIRALNLRLVTCYLFRQLAAAEEVADLEASSIFRVGTVSRIPLDALRMLLADRARLGVRRIGSAHQFAPIGDRVVLLESHDDDRTFGHELRQAVEEWLADVNGVEAC